MFVKLDLAGWHRTKIKSKQLEIQLAFHGTIVKGLPISHHAAVFLKHPKKKEKNKNRKKEKRKKNAPSAPDARRVVKGVFTLDNPSGIGYTSRRFLLVYLMS